MHSIYFRERISPLYFLVFVLNISIIYVFGSIFRRQKSHLKKFSHKHHNGILVIKVYLLQSSVAKTYMNLNIHARLSNRSASYFYRYFCLQLQWPGSVI